MPREAEQVFRVPLHPQGEGMIWVLHGLHQAIGGVGHGFPPLAQAVDPLVVPAVDRQPLLTHGAGKEAPRLQGDLVG